MTLKKLLAPLRYLIFLGIGVGLFWLTIKDLPLKTVFDKIGDADLFWILLSVLFSAIALICRTFRWIQLIEPLGYKPRFWATYNATMFGYLANFALPRLGEITRCGALGKSEEIPFDKLIGTVIIERASDVLMLFVSIILVALLEFDRLGGFLKDQFLIPLLAKMNDSKMIVAFLLIMMMVGLAAIIWLFKMKNPPQIIQKIKKLLLGIAVGLKSVTQLRNKWLYVFNSFFIWTMYWLGTYVSFHALSSTNALGASAGLFVMMLGAIGMTAPVQGGLGTYEILVVSGLLLYNIGDIDSKAFALMTHGTQTVLMIVLGVISMICLFFLTKPRSSRIHESSEKSTA